MGQQDHIGGHGHTGMSAVTRRRPVALAWALILGLVAMVGICLSWSPGLDGIRMAIRATARTSLAFFLLAYSASALCALWPGPWSAWIRYHRRQWGWLLVVSHTLHAIGLLAFWRIDPVLFHSMVPMATWISGGLAYLVLWSMGLTSFDRTAAWLGPVAWSRLHTWGAHYLCLSFLLTNGKRIGAEPLHLIPVGLLLLVLAMRWMVKAERASAEPA